MSAVKDFVVNTTRPSKFTRDQQGSIVVERNELFAGINLYGHQIVSWAWEDDREYTLRVVFNGQAFNTRLTVTALNRALEQLGIPGKVALVRGMICYECPSLNQFPTYIGGGLTIKSNGEVVR